jgi:integrase
MVNKYLRQWCQREGLEPFTFYAARHSFATLARRQGVEKATIDEALGHLGDYQVADIYAERNWRLAWEANRKVLELFRWPGSDNNRTKSGDTDGNQVPGQDGRTFS